jgi:hypothetical protein
MNVTFTQQELTNIRRAHNIEEKDERFHIKSNDEMRNEIVVEAYVNGLNACFGVESADEILSKNTKQEVERGSDKFEYELDKIYRVVNIDEPENITWHFAVEGFSEAGGFHYMKSDGFYITAQEALDAGEERVVELNKMTFEQQSKELW